MIERLTPMDIERFRERTCYKVNNTVVHIRGCRCKNKPVYIFEELNDYEDDPCDTCDSDIDCADCEHGAN